MGAWGGEGVVARGVQGVCDGVVHVPYMLHVHVHACCTRAAGVAAGVAACVLWALLWALLRACCGRAWLVLDNEGVVAVERGPLAREEQGGDAAEHLGVRG